MSNDVRLAVVGAGPQSLTLLSYLAVHRPHLLRECVVLDPEDWLTSWHRQFARLAIPLLRSGCVHHPHPQPYGLIRFARDRGRTQEFTGPIGRPSTSLFADYCEHLVDGFGLRAVRVPQRVVDLQPQTDGNLLIAGDGTRWRAERVVLATNPVRPVVPSWLGDARTTYLGEPGLLLSGQWRADAEPGRAGAVVVVGGGLTAAQIVAAHAEAGRMVNWITRSPLRVRDLDVEAAWLGPDLRRFHDAADVRARVSMAQRARGGGSIPADERGRVQELIASGRVEHIVAPVDTVRRHRGQWQVVVRHQGGARRVSATNVVCATGSRTHVRLEPLLRRCRLEHRIAHAGGAPALRTDLSWPGSSVHVMGPLAMAGVGPASRTVIGARMAAERIVTALGADIAPQYPAPRR